MNYRQSIEKRIAQSPMTITINLFFQEEIKTVRDGLTDTEQLIKLVNIGPVVVEEIPIRDGFVEKHIYWRDKNQRFVEDPYVWELKRSLSYLSKMRCLGRYFGNWGRI